ncbi:MAG: SpoIIE family protein phosphatase, partial [bacterium]
LLFTDGCTEQKNSADVMLSEERFIQRFRSAVAEGQEPVVKALYDYILRFAGGVRIADDISILLAEIKKR